MEQRTHTLAVASGLLLGCGALALCLACFDRVAAAMAAALLAGAFGFLVVHRHRGLIASHREQFEELQRMHRRTLEALVLAIDARDPQARGHARRVQAYAERLGQLVIDEAPQLFRTPPVASWLDSLGAAALLHDVGKLGIPDRLLTRHDPLSRGDREKVRQHARIGELILSRMPFREPLGPAVRSHHEHWDGTGYPDGLAGEAIPLEARIIHLADALDVVRRRSDSGEASPRDLVDMVARRAGVDIDPRLADIYCAHSLEIECWLAELDETASFSSSVGEDEDPLITNIGGAPKEAAALFDLASRLGTTLDVDETLAMAAARLLELLPAHSCALYLAESEALFLAPRYAAGPIAPLLARRTFARNEGSTGWAFATGEAVFNADPRIDLGRDTPREGEGAVLSAAVYPIADGPEVVGVIALYSDAVAAFTEDHRRILDTVAPQLTQVLRNALLFAETRASSMTDPLTSLPNNRFLHAQLGQELARATRKGLPLSLVVLDLDHFKPINDIHGHLAGDAVLRAIARELRDAFRVGDIVTRYAGDEFVALLPETSPEEARQIVRRIQERIGVAEFGLPDGGTVHIGISAGTSCFPLDGSSLEELVRRADREMYRDKSERKAREVLVGLNI